MALDPEKNYVEKISFMLIFLMFRRYNVFALYIFSHQLF
jgi:hypothetical protein